jgi:hypothetical protein
MKPELKENLVKDRKFNSILDQSLLEFESFYIFLAGLLKPCIKELGRTMSRRLEGLKDSEVKGLILFC